MRKSQRNLVLSMVWNQYWIINFLSFGFVTTLKEKLIHVWSIQQSLFNKCLVETQNLFWISVLLSSLLCIEFMHAESVIWEQSFRSGFIYSLARISWVHKGKMCNITRLLSGRFLFILVHCSRLSALTPPLSASSNVIAPEAGQDVDRTVWMKWLHLHF